ncbi:hypothetical protein GQ457_05G032600 [Hibiscus cannabinus]
MVWGQRISIPFICDACGTEGNCMSYICSTCNILVHKDCIKLPRIIKFSRHGHCLLHKYFLETHELSRKDHCKICFNEVKLERGSFSCVKPGCSYVVHVNCALEDDRFYEVVEQESQCEELYGAKSLQSSINRVLEVNEDGEATKIEHFIHQHCLVLADKIVEETDRQCDGCMLPVSTPFYYCSKSECHFCLHKRCVELPRVKRHWFYRSSATLYSTRFEHCDLCHRYCSGFFYKIGEWDVCVRCAEVADIIEFPGHEHILFYDFKCSERCNGCGKSGRKYRSFRCGECSFVLDFACLSLPRSVLHKSDQHMLNLTYRDDNDYSKHRYCDICEGKRDPSLWYYSCSICDTSAHPDCVLGRHPSLKDGIKFSSWHIHGNDLLFFRKAEGYSVSDCSRCGKSCREEFFKCVEPTCNYIIHCKCVELNNNLKLLSVIR